MALFKLLFSILLFSLVYCAPVEIPIGTPNEGHDPITTISDIDKDTKPPTESDVLISTRGSPTLSPREHSGDVIENNEGESLKSSVFVPTGVVKEEETIFPSSEFPLIRDSLPTSDPKVTSQTSDSAEKQHSQNENNNEHGSNPEAGSPAPDVKQKDDVKPLLGDDRDVRKPMDPQQPGDPFINDRVPILDPNPLDKGLPIIPEEPDVPSQNADGDLPQGPYEDGSLGQASEPFNEEGTNEGPRIYPEPPVEAETTIQDKFVYSPFKLSPVEDTEKHIAPESVQKDFTEIQSEPQDTDTDRLNSELPQEPMGMEPPQDHIGSELPQEPIGMEPPQEPIGSEFPQEPIGSEPLQEPIGSELPQEPIGMEPPQEHIESELPQEPIGMEPPQEPIGSESPQEPIGSEPPQEPIGSKLSQEPTGSEFQQEPIGSEFPQKPVASELPQDEAKQPEDVGSPFETYDDPTIENEDDTRLPTADQSNIPDEEADINPDSPFPVNVDGPEEMVGNPVELPREEADPPAILVRDDLVPPVVSVIQIEQQAPPYLNRGNVPLSEDSVGGEMPEEEVSNPDNTEPGMLSFDNRPEESGPMNIL